MSPRPSLLAALLLALAPVAQADDAVVGTGTPASCTDAALDAAIFEVYFGSTQGGRVSFDCGGSPVTIALASSKLLDAGVGTEIDGGGLVTLDAGNQHRHFEIRDSGTVVTLRGLTLRSGQASDFGGAAYVSAGAGLFVYDGRFFNNGAVTAGGAIAGEPGSSLGILDSRFDLNSAGSGGAIAKTGQLTIEDSSFNENAATDQGGALQWWFPTGGEIVASVFTANTAAIGGAVLVRGGTACLDDVRLDANIASADGGGLYVYDDAQIEVLHRLQRCPGLRRPNVSEGGNLLGELACGSHPSDLQPASLTVLGLGTLVEIPFQHFYLPAPTSPAVDFPACAPGAVTDQRGQSTNRDGDGDGFLGCDAGAIELQSVDEVPPTGSALLLKDGFESP